MTPAPPPAPARLGRFMSLAMVVGTMVGSGIYLLPATLAPSGRAIPFAWALTIAGTMTLAWCLARLAAAMPGGPYVHIRAAFGDRAAFVTLWSYIVSQWTGVAAVVVAVAGALGHVFPAAAGGAGLVIVSLAAIAALLVVNLQGARSAGGLQVAATLVKIVPLLLVALILAARIGGGGHAEPLAPVALGPASIIGAAALMLFSLTGFEAAATTAKVTADSQAVVPRATMIGTGLTGALYFIATLATLAILPSALAVNSSAPFADAIAPALGPTAGLVVALVAAVSAFGTGNALLLISAEISQSLAEAGDLPPAFARTNARGAPAPALWLGAGIAALLVIFSASPSFVSVYIFITLISTVATLLLYAVAAAAALRLKVMGGTAWIAVVGILYAVAMFVGAGLQPTLWGIVLALIGLPIRWISRRRWPSPAAADAATAPRE
ncbi:amino acid permease [Sphingomonas sp. ASV193]|uniref:APC family permease n=1 Tax=Sphingomonas sp. ASV193 TaxID=3144405 RepID=UPI0032E8E9C7